MGNAWIALLALGLVLLGGDSKKPGSKVSVKIGPAKIKPPGKVTVKIGPARIKAPAKGAANAVHVVAPPHPKEHLPVTAHGMRHANIDVPDLQAAKKNAQPIADMVRTKGKKYDHAKLKAWQMLAGLKPDGVYGPNTAKALRHLGAKSVADKL